jgi:hypothetical protein
MTSGENRGGGFGASVTDSEAMLSHYLEQGGNFIDPNGGGLEVLLFLSR